MQSIKELYKIGRGPSSSHTMGPEKAALVFKKRYPDLNYKVVLYGSLSLTGKGHLTDVVLKEVLETEDIVFSSDFIMEHPNTLDFFAYDKQGILVGSMRVFSVGGGAIKIDGEPYSVDKNIYELNTFRDISDYCIKNKLKLYEYVYLVEGKELYNYLEIVWNQMKDSIQNGLSKDGILPGVLEVERKAKSLLKKSFALEPQEIKEKRLVSAYAFAVSETNANGGYVVTAPTCGASGVLPAVLFYLQERYSFKDEDIINSLATAGLIGNLIKFNASISGAEAGCQAEIGSACAMAAGAQSELYDLSLEQIEYAAEIALEHHLGLTCDPIYGYVQIPCIERNAVAALRAIDASSLAFFLTGSRKISFDMVVETMLETGKDLNKNYRETSGGGLATNYKKPKKVW